MAKVAANDGTWNEALRSKLGMLTPDIVNHIRSGQDWSYFTSDPNGNVIDMSTGYVLVPSGSSGSRTDPVQFQYFQSPLQKADLSSKIPQEVTKSLQNAGYGAQWIDNNNNAYQVDKSGNIVSNGGVIVPAGATQQQFTNGAPGQVPNPTQTPTSGSGQGPTGTPQPAITPPVSGPGQPSYPGVPEARPVGSPSAPAASPSPNSGQQYNPITVPGQNTQIPVNGNTGNAFQPGQPGTTPRQPNRPMTPNDRFTNAFAGTGYETSPALQQVLQEFTSASKGGSGYLGTDAVADQWSGFIKGMVDKFSQQYSNATGGVAPTPDKINTFIQNTIVPMQIAHAADAGPTQIAAWNSQADNSIQNLLSSTFSSDIQDANTKRLTDASTKATAPGSAFDVWQNAYRGSIDSTKNALTDYQTKLFQKLQPNLLTSLQAKGLLDTGALNTAFAGAASDLSAANQGYIADITGRAEQDIAGQRYNIMNAPNASLINNWTGQVPNLTATGQGALNNAFNYDTSLNAANLNNIWNRQNYEMQQGNQGSPLSQYGGLILGGIAGGIPGAIGGYMANRYATNKKAA